MASDPGPRPRTGYFAVRQLFLVCTRPDHLFDRSLRLVNLAGEFERHLVTLIVDPRASIHPECEGLGRALLKKIP
jgi:hypothetical protein